MLALPSRRLYWRTALYIGAALAAFLALGIASLLLLASQELANYTATRHGNLGREAAAVLEKSGREGLARWLRDEASVPENVTIYVLDEQARDILGRPLPDLYARFVRRSVVGPPLSADSNYRPVRLAPQLIAPDGTSFAFLVLPNRIGILGNPTIAAVWLAAAVLVIASVAWLIARAFARPIAELQSTVRELASGQIGARVPAALASRPDEIGALATDVNSMADRISALIEHRSRLMGELSHELRSPLARLSASVALATHRGTIAPAERSRIEQEVARMDRLIGDLLRYSRLEAAPLPARRLVRIDLLLADLVRDEEVEASARSCRLQVQAPAELRVVGDPEWLRSAIENVLRNAIRHSPAGQSVQLRAARANDQVLLEVLDRGPGVPADQLQRIFEPFVRLDIEGARDDAQRSGLGLAIARRVVEAHGGAIAAYPREGGGLRVTMRLPAVELG